MAIVKPPRDCVSAKVASTVSAATSIQPARSLPRGCLAFLLPSFYSRSLQVPDEYLTASRIGGKVPVVELQRSHTDLLFFNFYAGHGDRLQLTAASLLFERGWRFNIPNQVLSLLRMLLPSVW